VGNKKYKRGKRQEVHKERAENPTFTEFPTIIYVEISSNTLNLDSLPKLPMVEMINSSNDSGILNTYMVLGFLHMLSKSRWAGMIVPYVCSVLIDPLVNWSTCFSNIWNTAGTWNQVITFHVLWVDRVLSRTKRIFYGP